MIMQSVKDGMWDEWGQWGFSSERLGLVCSKNELGVEMKWQGLNSL